MPRRKKEAGAKFNRDDEKTAVEAPEVEQSDTVEKDPEQQPEEKAEPAAKEESKPEPSTPKTEKPVVLVVVDGRSLITRRGIRGPGDDVTAQELPGGEELLQHLKDNGFLEVEKKKEARK